MDLRFRRIEASDPSHFLFFGRDFFPGGKLGARISGHVGAEAVANHVEIIASHSVALSRPRISK